MTPGDIEQSLNAFRRDLTVLDHRRVVQTHITSGNCVAITTSQYAEVRARVARHFTVHPTQEVVVVGSARLGFSVAPSKRWKHFDDESDIDVAIVSAGLYRDMWGQLSNFTLDGGDWARKRDFLNHKLHGWMRPDLLPTSAALPLADEWFEFFRGLTQEGICGPYKISGGLYYDITFLESYQERAVSLCNSLGEDSL